MYLRKEEKEENRGGRIAREWRNEDSRREIYRISGERRNEDSRGERR